MLWENSMKPPFASVAIIEHEDKLLLVERRDAVHGLTYETPGGKIEPGETPEDCVIREVFEETGLNIEIVDFIKSFYFNDNKVNYYFCKIIGDQKMNANNIVFVEKNKMPDVKITNFAKNNLSNLGYFLNSPFQIYRDRKYFFAEQSDVDKYIRGNNQLANNAIESIAIKDKIIVSLTTYPDRIETVYLTIYSLLFQTIKPFKILLWLSKDEFSNMENDLPDSLLHLKKSGLEVRWVEDNLKSFKKLIYSLTEFPDDLIITVDDDVYYQPDCIERLYSSYLDDPDKISCHKASKITFNCNGCLNKYDDWIKHNNGVDVSIKNIATGVGGVLYKSNFLNKQIFDQNLFMKLTPTTDDIWFWAMAVLNRTKTKIIKDNIDIVICTDINTIKTPSKNLYGVNILNDRNTECVKTVIDYFNLKDCLLEESV
jgi:mutator protein MutT